jgi:histidinol phosphatase-like enzyme (inositol monophosphatase family)
MPLRVSHRDRGEPSEDAPVRPRDLASWLAAAHDFADAAGEAIRPYFRRRMTVDNKDGGGGFDPVTAADRAAERAVARELKRRFPAHGIAGEEYGAEREGARMRWVVDPIDGTKAFILGLPTWGTLIGLLDGDAPIVGLMDQPFTQERFWAGGKGAWHRVGAGKPKRLRTRECARLADAMMATTSPDLFKAGAESDRFLAMRRATRMTRYGTDCYAYCLVAAGHIDLVVEAGLKPVDIVALIPIIEQAGGCVTNWTGGSAIDGGQVVASGTPKLHESALRLLAR